MGSLLRHCVLLDQGLEDTLPLRTVGLQVLLVRLGGDKATGVKIGIHSLNQLGTTRVLVREEQDGGQDPREPGAQKTLGIPITILAVLGQGFRRGISTGVMRGVDNRQVAGGNDAAAADNGGQDVTVRVAPGDVRELADGTALGLPAVTEAEVEEQNQDPGLEDDGADDGDEPLEDNTRTDEDGDQRQARAESDDSDSDDGNTASVGVTDLLVGPAITGERQQHAGGDVEVRVDGREDGSEDDGVHVVGSALQTGLDEDNGERGLGSRSGRVDQQGVVVGDDRAEQKDRGKVEEGNTDQDGVDGLGDVLMGVAGLGSSDTSHLRSTIGISDRDQYFKEGHEAALEGSSLDAPVGNTVGGTTDGASINKDTADDEDDDGEDLENREPVLELSVSLDTGHVDEDHQDNNDNGDDPGRERRILANPELDNNCRGRELSRDGQSPVDEVHVSHLKGESLVKDTATPGVEGTREGQESSDLTDSLADKDEPETDEGISEKSTTGTGSGDGRTGGQEETGTDGTRDSDHDHVAETEITLETLLFGSHMDLTLTDILHLVDLELFRHLVSVFEFRHFVLVVKVEGWVGKESCERQVRS